MKPDPHDDGDKIEKASSSACNDTGRGDKDEAYKSDTADGAAEELH